MYTCARTNFVDTGIACPLQNTILSLTVYRAHSFNKYTVITGYLN